MTMIVSPEEFHISIRVADLAESTKFYTAFLGVEPKDRMPRFSTFLVPSLKLNLVLLVNDSGKPLDTYSLYHIGLGVRDKAAVIESFSRARAAGAHIVKPPRTTWRGTPLHELWLRDPTGYGIEVYARLNLEELSAMPLDMEPTYLVPAEPT
ncbi:VOC family protein [Acidovorax sp. A1169]|uniref:VOC family protein n=1 Tax=Acidovorax sp. A1169 TaxID=3059524 RepID=UPI002737F37B|nr:VOC family protein [Acidovorax sp. A1169]MDP4076343.1 VOC family protein [Acidovorax sp. A1169]